VHDVLLDQGILQRSGSACMLSGRSVAVDGRRIVMFDSALLRCRFEE
jgi:hypothetical protein